MEFLKNALIADLTSPDRLIREMALLQLSSATDQVTLAAFKDALTKETDPYLKNQIEQLVKTNFNELGENELEKNPAFNSLSLVDRWLSDISKVGRQKILEEVKKKTSCEIIHFIDRTFASTTRNECVLPLLPLSTKFLDNPYVRKHLESLLHSSDTMVLYRVLLAFLPQAPQLLIKHVPYYLKHPNFNIKLTALRILYKVSPNDAITLLERMVLQNEKFETLITSALFLFPFEHTYHIVLNLLDKKLKFNETALKFLVRNNPNQKFFDELNLLNVRENQTSPLVKELIEIAAESLVCCGSSDLSKEELIKKSEKQARGFLASAAGLSILEDITEVAEINQKEISDDLRDIVGKDSLDKEGMQKIHELIGISDLSNANLKKILEIIHKFELQDDSIREFVQKCLQIRHPGIVLLAIKSLLLQAPTKSLKTLSELANHENSVVATNSLRLMLEQNPKAFEKIVTDWVISEQKSKLKISLAVMMMADLDQSRKIVLNFLKSTTDLELIKFFSPIFLVSPERQSIQKLELLAKYNRGQKKESLEWIINELKKSLNISQDTESSQQLLKNAGLENFESYIGKINSSNQNFIRTDRQSQSSFYQILSVSGIGVLFFVFFVIKMILPQDSPKSELKVRKAKTGKLVKAQNLPAQGSKINIRLLKFDPVSGLWSGIATGNQYYKFVLPGSEKFSRHDSLEITVKKAQQTSFGGVIITAEATRKQTG